MSKKRTSTESNNDEQTTDDSGEAFRQVDNAKRGKFASLSDTALQDIPTEILQCILVKAITMEVKNMKLAKFVWKEKAELVISRLGSVCSQWSSVLTTNFFRLELHRALDGIAQETIRMELLHESLVNGFVIRVTSLRDEMLMLFRHSHQCIDVDGSSVLSYSSSIAVYDRNNMKEVKEVIALPGIDSVSMAACNVLNCVYALEINAKFQCTSILRIARDEEQKFNIQTWISDKRFPISSCYLSVSGKGNLIIISRPDRSRSYVVWVYNANGFLLHEIMLTPETHGFHSIESSAIQKSNGNLLLALVNSEFHMVLMEINTDGIIQRQRTSSLLRWGAAVDFADTSGRILTYDDENRIELYDSELNLLEFTYPRSDQQYFEYIHNFHFNSERNEVMALYALDDYEEDETVSLLRIFRFREE